MRTFPPEQIGVALFICDLHGDSDFRQRISESLNDIDTKHHNGKTLLHFAAGRGWDAMVDVLIEAGANVEATDKNGLTPLMFAMHYGHDSIICALTSAKNKKQDFEVDDYQPENVPS